MQENLQAIRGVDTRKCSVIFDPDKARNDIANLKAGIGKDPMVERGIGRCEDVTVGRDASDPVASD